MYHLIKRACTGYKKLAKGKGSQDAIDSVKLKNACIVAVADGHGDSSCTRSDKGATFAVKAFISVMRDIVAKVALKELYAHVLKNKEQIIQDIVRDWNLRVFEDFVSENQVFAETNACADLKNYLQNLFKTTAGEITSAQANQRFNKISENEDLLKKITHLYGTTLNGVIITEKFMFCLGIGDGDIVFVQNKMAFWLLPPSEQFSTTTASMCYKPQKAVQSFSSNIVRFNDNKKNSNQLLKTGFNPDYVMIATDGLRNSFISDWHFTNKLIEIAKLKKSNFATFKVHSREWIETLTAESVYQDDVTLCLIYK